MSQFSGKCDFYDSVIAIHCDGDMDKLEEYLANTDIYVRGKDGRDHLVVVRTEKDAVKYYPYLESIAAYNREGRNTICLSSQSFIDSEEADHIGWHVRDAYKYWNKCKRNKVKPDVENYLANTWWSNEDMDRTIIERIIKNGKKAEFDDLHDSLHEYLRRRWFEEMVRVGWNVDKAFNWCFNEFYPQNEVVKERLGEELYVKYFTEK